MFIPVYLINLERSSQRYSDSKTALDKVNIKFEKITAVDGHTIDRDKLSISIDSDYSRYHKKLSNTEIGCFLSHIECWKRLLQSDAKFALILEDDLFIKGKVVDALAEIKNIATDWDCIKLIEQPIKRRSLHIENTGDFQLVTYDKIPSRTGAYVLSKSGAQKMLKKCNSIGRPIDIEFQYWWEKDLKVFGLKPYVFDIRKNTPSTIDLVNDRSNRASHLLVKAKQLAYYRLANFWFTRKRIKSFT